MRIAFDAKWYFDGPPSGRNVTRNMIKWITELDTSDHLIIILDRKHRREPFPFESPRVTLLYVWSGNNLLSNLFIVPLVIRKHKADVLVSQTFTSFLGSFRKVTFIYDVIFRSEPQHFSLIERVYFAPLRFLSKFADTICTDSQSEKDRIVHYGYAQPDRVEVIHNGVDDIFFGDSTSGSQKSAISLKYNLPASFVLYVGRLTSRKNVDNLLRAFSMFCVHHPGFQLVLVGKRDSSMSHLETLLDELRIHDRTVLAGYIPDEDLPGVYALASVFCYLSVAEGFGIPPLEAMASGTPVIVSDIAVHREVCGDAAAFVDPNDLDGISKHLSEIVSGTKLREENIKRGIQRARQFTWKNSAQKLLEVLHKGTSRHHLSEKYE
jgi:glycosyltransferase involved in cell wall biosynthesis